MNGEELAGRSKAFREAFSAGVSCGSVDRCRQWEFASSQMADEAAGAAASMPSVEICVDGLSSVAAFRADSETSVRSREAAEGFAAAAEELEERAERAYRQEREGRFPPGERP